MRKAIYGCLAVTAIAVVLLGTYQHAFTQESQESKGKNPSSSAAIPSQEISPALAINEGISRTYVVHGSGPSSIPASSWTAVDPGLTIVCPGTTGKCTITADISVQSGGGSTASNSGAVALSVDGTIVCTSDASNGCHYAAEIPSDGRFVEDNELNQLSGVTLGNHTVQTFVWSDNGAVGGFYNIRYQVLKP